MVGCWGGGEIVATSGGIGLRMGERVWGSRMWMGEVLRDWGGR